jgi:hypothetical protein
MSCSRLIVNTGQTASSMRRKSAVHAYLVTLQNIKSHHIMRDSNSVDAYCLVPHYKQTRTVAAASHSSAKTRFCNSISAVIACMMHGQAAMITRYHIIQLAAVWLIIPTNLSTITRTLHHSLTQPRMSICMIALSRII